MRELWQEDWTLGALDVSPARRLRFSALLAKVQLASIAHATALGAGREKTLDRGLLWAVSRVRARFARVPRYDERVRLVTWPGETMHALFPRYFELLDGEGRQLVLGSSLWLLMDGRTRRMAFPEEWGVEVPGLVRGDEPELPPALLPVRGPESGRTVLYSDTDLNGHMNNSRYADWADDLLGGERLAGLELRLAQINYQREAREGTALLLRSSFSGGVLRAEGLEETQRVFSVFEEFEETGGGA
jgi:acyl-ACP thioesterase